MYFLNNVYYYIRTM